MKEYNTTDEYKVFFTISETSKLNQVKPLDPTINLEETQMEEHIK